MKTLVLIVNGGTMGYVAGEAFGTGPMFWGAIVASAILITTYGILCKNSD